MIYNYNKLTPFKKYIIQNFPYIDADFDALTNYELYAKVVDYLNKVIDEMNGANEQVEILTNAYNDLHDYVQDYFDNLDVQEEINNKLDEMATSGELQQIVNNIFEILENQIQTLASGSPIPVSSTSQMTNTSKIYVNTTDGKWYYYDGDSWEIGGTYQSTGISNSSIDILMLDDKLKSNFFSFYGNNIDLGTGYQGYMTRTGQINNTDANYIYYSIPLTLGKIYTYSGKNMSQVCGLVVKDSSNNVVYAAGTQAETKFVSLIFRANENGLTAYLSYKLSEITNKGTLNAYTSGLRELTDIYNNLKYTNTIPLVAEIDGKYVASNTITVGENTTDIAMGTINHGITKIYQLTNGHTYNFTGYNYASVCGLLIIGLDRYVYYASSTSGGVPITSFSYTYTATSDGFIILSSANPSEMPFTIELVETNVEINYETNKLNGLKLGADGDSLMHGNENNNVSYADLIASENNMSLNKNAVGGGTIATGTYSAGETPRHWICESVLNLDANCNVVIVNGGVNDYWNNVPLGSITPDYTTTVDSSTFYGGLETLFRNLLSRFPNKKIAFITNHNINNILTQNNSINLKFKNYYDAIIETAQKYAIPVIDMTKNSQLNTGIAYFKNTYTVNSDGVHPNTNGYNIFYVPYITNRLKELL